MRRQTLATMLGVATLAGAAGLLSAQTYSYTEDPGVPFMGPVVVTVTRDGVKEVVEQVMPPMEGRPKEYHGRLFYDFAAHKIYTQVLSDPDSPCSVMTYTSATAPPELDVIAGAADLMKKLSGDAKAPLKKVGVEVLEGTPTTIFEQTNTDGKVRVWLADKGGFPMKVVATGPDGKEQTVLAVKRLSYTKPAAALLVEPKGCVAITGTATTNSVSTGDADTASKYKVTAATLAPIANYKGVCPAHLTMTGTITTDGPGTVWYRFGAGKMDPGEELKFTDAGTKPVRHVMTLDVDPKFGNDMGGSALLEAVMEDTKGGHALSGTGSNNVDFSLVCVR